MDAALCINTLDQISTTPEVPVVPDFALIDLAGTQGFLKSLYGAMERTPIRWSSLLEGTRWQSGWQFGPILVDLRDRADFQETVIGQLSVGGIGVLIDSRLDYDDILAWSTSRLLAFATTDDRLFRFYDSRSLKALLAVLETHSPPFLPIDATLSWHDTTQWISWRDHDGIHRDTGNSEWILSEAELALLPDYRMAERACRLSYVYSDHINAAGDKRVWVLEQLRQALNCGFLKASQQERFLRVSIQSNGALLSDPKFKALRDRVDMTDDDRLKAMECLVEPYHAAT